MKDKSEFYTADPYYCKSCRSMYMKAYYKKKKMGYGEYVRTVCPETGEITIEIVEHGQQAPLPGAKPRKCLYCDEMFDSCGPGNRICSACEQCIERKKGEHYRKPCKLGGIKDFS